MPALEFKNVDAPSTVGVGESFTVSMTVGCTVDSDDISYLCTGTITISSGMTEFFREDVVHLYDGEEKTFSATVTLTTTGTHTIQFGAGEFAKFRDVTVVSDPDPTADISVSSVNVPTHPTVGLAETVTIFADNFGDAAGSESFTVTANGRSIGSVTFNIDAGTFGSEELSWTPQEAGSVTIAAGDDPGTTVDVQPSAAEANIQVTGVSASPNPVSAGSQTTISVAAKNTGDVTGSREFPVYIGSDTREVSFDLGPGQTGTETLSWTFGSAGTFTAEAGFESTSITVQQASGGGGDGGSGDGDGDSDDGLLPDLGDDRLVLAAVGLAGLGAVAWAVSRS